MKWMLGRTAMWVWGTLALATVAFATAQDVRLPDGDGKKIVENACGSCHSLEPITRLHQDKERWEAMVSSMIAYGAQVNEKELPVLIDYLVKNFGPAGGSAGKSGSASGTNSGASEAAAKKLLEDACTTCHDLGLVTEQRLSKEAWQEVINNMVARGASLSERDNPVLVEYLAKTYGPR
jgi:cytochrome c5